MAKILETSLKTLFVTSYLYVLILSCSVLQEANNLTSVQTPLSLQGYIFILTGFFPNLFSYSKSLFLFHSDYPFTFHQSTLNIFPTLNFQKSKRLKHRNIFLR